MSIYRQHITFVGSRMYLTNKIISMEYLYFLPVDLPLQFTIPDSIWLSMFTVTAATKLTRSGVSPRPLG